jgi:orotate phosphoribosyltransferase
MVDRPVVSVRMSGKEIAKACKAYYLCPKDQAGNRLGPLAGYASRDEHDRQKVGEEYMDFAKIEQWPHIVQQQIVPVLVSGVQRTIGPPHRFVWCGMPEGGKTLTTLLANNAQARFVYPEKVVEKSDGVTKPKTRLLFQRHEITPGDDIIIVEDVTNEFSTTQESIDMIESLGGKVAGVATFLNRSPVYRSEFPASSGGLPVVSVWNEAMQVYRQDDPFVADDIQKGNVIWQPKLNWNHMLAAQGLRSAA